MKKILQKTIAIVLSLLFIELSASGQAAYMGRFIGTGSTTSDFADSLYLGPGTYQIDGTWQIYCGRTIIDTTAIFTGTGVIEFYNPSAGLGSSMPNHIDANNLPSAIDVNISHQNDQGIVLTELPFPTELTSTFGWAENTSSTTLYAGREIDLAVDGADITLGTGVVGDLRFDNDATISNYRPERMVIVNNSILSHMVKESFTTAFTFPVGMADGDYTPAQISNSSSNTVRVSVQDYAASASPEALLDGAINTADGMNRTWHIYADNSGISSNLNLQHNSSTNQTGFVDATHFVTQWGSTTPNTTGDNAFAFSSSPWQSNTQAAGALGTLSTAGSVSGSSMRSRTYSGGLATTAIANQSYFTKSADMLHPLPINLVSFNAEAQQCDVVLRWTSGVEVNCISYLLQHSTNGNQFQTIGTTAAKGSNTAYIYVHKKASQGNNFYRIKMIDVSNNNFESPTLNTRVDCNTLATQNIRVFPNPSEGQINLEGLNTTRGNATIQVLNLQGLLIRETTTDEYKASINISDLPSAMYQIRVLEGDQIKHSSTISKR